MVTKNAVCVEGVSKQFGTAQVLRSLDLSIEKGQFVCILGASGCGKTTLLRIIAGFEKADAGKVFLAGKDVTSLPTEARDFGIVFQSYALFPSLTIAENVGFGLRAARWGKALIKERVDHLLQFANLADQANKYPNQLSGGQQQRVALIRALALSPSLLLLDEPLSALDAQVRQHLRDELKNIQKNLNITTLMVTHDQDEALSLADQIVVMNAGRIEQIGSPQAIYDRPASLFVASFIGKMNQLPIDAFGDGWVESAAQRFVLHLAHPNGSPSKYSQAARLCIRPEAILLGEAAQKSENRLLGRVDSIVFNGLSQHIKLKVPKMASGNFQVIAPRRPGERLIRSGEMIPLALPSESLLVLDQVAA